MSDSLLEEDYDQFHAQQEPETIPLRWIGLWSIASSAVIGLVWFAAMSLRGAA